MAQPDRSVIQSVRLMGEVVIPALKDVLPLPSLVDELAKDKEPPATTEQLQAARFGPAPSDVTAT